MTTSLALVGWLAAFATALVARHTGARRRELIARACHELRGPLTAARLGLELGLRRGELSAERLRAVELELARAGLALEDLGGAGGGAGGRRLGRRGRSARCAFELVDVADLLAQSVAAWQAVAARRGASLRLIGAAPELLVRGDRLRLAQATGNLIANAIEHGGGSVEVRARADAGRVRIEILDGGPGLPVPVDELARRPRAGRGARGRGLAIATTIAESHGGRICSAPSERGARIVLELPASRTAGRLVVVPARTPDHAG